MIKQTGIVHLKKLYPNFTKKENLYTIIEIKVLRLVSWQNKHSLYDLVLVKSVLDDDCFA